MLDVENEASASAKGQKRGNPYFKLPNRAESVLIGDKGQVLHHHLNAGVVAHESSKNAASYAKLMRQ